MTVAELIAELQKQPGDSTVKLHDCDLGYTSVVKVLRLTEEADTGRDRWAYGCSRLSTGDVLLLEKP